MIERFPTPGSIASIGREEFTEQVWPLIGRKVSKARVVNDIYETACASMALPIDEDSTAVKMFRMVIAQARTLIRQRNEIERIAHDALAANRSEEHTSELQSLMRISYAVFCLKKKNKPKKLA